MEDAAAAFEQGNQRAREGKLDEAEAAYERASALGHALAATSVGLLRERRGDLSGAEEAYRLADTRGDAQGAFRLGLLLSARDDWDGAKAAWARSDERGGAAAPFELERIIEDHDRELEHERLAQEWESVGGGRSRTRSAFADPVLIGAACVLALLVAVFLAYNSNAGLPFVPTRELKVDLSDGSNLVVGNDVREGGYRIGVISAVQPARFPDGEIGAQLTVKLGETYGQVPIDSRATVYSKSVLGLKFLDLTKGSSQQMFRDGATMDINHTTVPVQIDQVFNMFDTPTRTAIQKDLVGFGDTFAARGSAFNDTVASLPQLLLHLRPVAQYLSAPPTELTRLLTSLDQFMRVVAPVANVNSQLFTDMATTFAAISNSPGALESTIAKSPSTLSVSTTSLKVQQPFLTDFASLGRSLTPASAELRAALPDINPAIEVGTSTLRRTPPLNARLQQVMRALRTLAMAPGTNVALNALTSTVGTLNPMVKYLGPYQTVCDDWNYWWTYLSEHLSEATSFGFAQRVLLMLSNTLQPNNVGSQGATAPVNGGGSTSPLTGGNEFLHSQNYGAAIDNQGNADCETGQRGYPLKLNYFDPQGRNLAIDPHTPGDQGPTFAGRARVPAGETYSRNPQTGPQLAANPSNP
jgi:virulence factor Mce-like protein